MTKINRDKLASFYLTLDEKGKGRQSNLFKYVADLPKPIDYNTYIVADLKAFLDEKGISYTATATKAELIALLESN